MSQPRIISAEFAEPNRPRPSAVRSVPDTEAVTEAYASRRLRIVRATRDAAVLMLAAAVDVGLAIPAFNAVLRQSPFLSWLCAIGFAVITIVASFNGGLAAKNGRVHIAVGYAVGAVGAIGALLVLRLYAASLTISTDTFGTGMSAAQPAAGEIPIATVMGIFMLCTAGVAFLDGSFGESPRARRLRIATEACDAAQGRADEWEGQCARFAEDLHTAEHELDCVETEYRQARKGLEAFAGELCEHARTLIATHLGNPTATSGLDLPARPKSPATMTDPTTNTDE